MNFIPLYVISLNLIVNFGYRLMVDLLSFLFVLESLLQSYMIEISDTISNIPNFAYETEASTHYRIPDSNAIALLWM